ncbi:uncharacterized protein [Procambarus clarkii]|uniref:uncharacterized protein n=1 Tax=Procambarus clarkii TaxID=6728 RepID=UPI0037422C7A
MAPTLTRSAAGLLLALLMTQHAAECQQSAGAQESRGIPTTQVLGGVQRFRQVLRIQDNRQRLPQVIQHQQEGGTRGDTQLSGIQEEFHTARAPKPSGANGVQRVPEAQRTPGGLRVPVATRTPGALRAPVATRTPGALRAPLFLKPPEKPDNLNGSEIPKAHGGQTTSQIPRRPENLRIPDAPRVPEVPNHLPLGLTNRLHEFPSLAESLHDGPESASMHSFFEPSIQVEAEELSDEEWSNYLESEWGSDQVVPGLLPAPPPFVANVNFGSHQCVHLGNTITPAHARHRPKFLEFPGQTGRHYTILLLDLDAPAPPYLHWLLLDVPSDHFHKGVEVVEYEGPRPGQDTGLHRLVFLVYLQQQQHSTLPTSAPGMPSARACQRAGREGIDLTQLTRDLDLKGPIAANYFLSEWDVTVEHTCVDA